MTVCGFLLRMELLFSIQSPLTLATSQRSQLTYDCLWFSFKDGAFVFYPISIDACDKSEKSTDVLDTLMNSLKESAHMCNLQCLEEVGFFL